MSRDNAYVSPGVYLVSCIGSDHQPKNPSPPPVEEPPYKYCATCARKMPDDDDEEEEDEILETMREAFLSLNADV